MRLRSEYWAAVFAIAAGLSLGLVVLINGGDRASVADPSDEPFDSLGYSPNELRPSLSPPEEASIPTPATHIVEEGDTLLAIALRFGSSVEAIQVASGLADADFLSIGQALVIPPARSVLQPVDPFLTIREIAGSYGTAPEIVATYNGRSPDRVDESIERSVAILPPVAVESSSRELASTRGAEVPSEASSEETGDAAVAFAAPVMTYTVVDGDTILGIAARLGVEPDALVAANRLPDSNWIIAGDQLEIPLWSRPARDIEIAESEEPGVSVASVPEEPQAVQEAAVQPPTPFVYEIAPGDTLHDVAWRFGVDVYTIVNNNDLTDADRIKVGDQITILPVSGLLYTVEPGDTLTGIAQTFKVDLGPVIDFNYLEDSDFISVGQKLILPGASPLPPPPPPPAPPQRPTVYQVQPGDTVNSIAQRFGVDASDIIAANGLRSADRISIGDQLRIVPGQSAAAASARPAAQAPAPPRTSSQTAAPARAPAAPQQVTVNLPVPAPPPATAARPSTPGGGGAIVSVAMQYRGSRYVWGGTTPAGFDCSGFVYFVHNRAGKPISRGMWGQYNAGPHPGRGELQPGDIVFFQNTYMRGLSHNGIYIGNGQFIHASDPGSGVKISSLSESYWASRWFGATRVW